MGLHIFYRGQGVTWVALIKYIFSWVKNIYVGLQFLCELNFFCAGLSLCVGHFFVVGLKNIDDAVTKIS